MGARPGLHRAIVLAAGRGRRMGVPKALMVVDGAPWWRDQDRSLRAAGARPLWVVSPAVRDALAKQSDAPRELVVADPDAPMFESVITGVRAIAGDAPDGLFVLPVDVPAPGPAVFKALAQVSPVGVPRHAGATGHPVRLSWSWVREHLLDADPSARRLDVLIDPEATIVDVEDACVVTNLNTPADLASWRSARRER